jgi:predicted amidophosphoribosyltransferase
MKTPAPKAPSSLLQSARRYPGVERLYHVAYYHAARVGYQDIVSRSLHDFKDGCEPQTARWIALAAPRVCKDLSFDIIVRALGTAEVKASPNIPLDRLCVAIAGGSGAAYEPERLEKERAVRALTSLGGKIARQKELGGVYRFDASGLVRGVKILLVDDIATTGATLEAISRAITVALPGAVVTCFVLARVEAQLQNRHIDPDYFLKGEQADPAHPGARMSPRAHEDPSEFQKRTNRTPASRPASIPASGPDTQKRRKSSGQALPASVPSKAAALEQKGKVRKGLHTRFYVLGLLLSLLLLGATVFIPVKKEPAPPTSQFVQLVNQSEITSPEPIPERRPVQPAQTLPGKPAVVTVPSTGLRTSHSMESRVISKTIVRQKEHVEILRRYSSQTGPDWILVRTNSGTIGWVVASVVKEMRG